MRLILILQDDRVRLFLIFQDGLYALDYFSLDCLSELDFIFSKTDCMRLILFFQDPVSRTLSRCLKDPVPETLTRTLSQVPCLKGTVSSTLSGQATQQLPTIRRCNDDMGTTKSNPLPDPPKMPCF